MKEETVRRLVGNGILIVGTGALGRATAADFEDRRGASGVIGYLSWRSDCAPSALPAPLLGTSTDLAGYLARHRVREVYLAARPEQHGDELASAARTCEAFGVRFAVPLVPFRLTRGRARHGGWVDGYIHYVQGPEHVLALMIERFHRHSERWLARWAWAPLMLLVRLVLRPAAARRGAWATARASRATLRAAPLFGQAITKTLFCHSTSYPVDRSFPAPRRSGSVGSGADLPA